MTGNDKGTASLRRYHVLINYSSNCPIIQKASWLSSCIAECVQQILSPRLQQVEHVQE